MHSLVVLQIQEKMVAAVSEIKECMDSIHRVFEQDSEEVQREWVRYTQKIDKKVEDAIRYTVKKSLQVTSLCQLAKCMLDFYTSANALVIRASELPYMRWCGSQRTYRSSCRLIPVLAAVKSCAT